MRQNIRVQTNLELVYHSERFSSLEISKELVSERTRTLQFFTWPKRVSMSEITAVQMKAKLLAFICVNKIFGVKT